MSGASTQTILVALAVQAAPVAMTQINSVVALVRIIKSIRELGHE